MQHKEMTWDVRIHVWILHAHRMTTQSTIYIYLHTKFTRGKVVCSLHQESVKNTNVLVYMLPFCSRQGLELLACNLIECMFH